MTLQDRTEAALMAEFGSYVSAVAQTFSKPLQSALEEAERKMLVRIGEQRDAAERTDQATKKALAELGGAARKEVAKFAKEVDDLQTLIATATNNLVSSREAFESSILRQLQDTCGPI